MEEGGQKVKTYIFYLSFRPTYFYSHLKHHPTKDKEVISSRVVIYNMMTTVTMIVLYIGFPGGSDGKESACNVGDLGSIPGSGRFPGEGNGNPLQHSCLENSMGRGAFQVTVHGIAKSQTPVSDFTFISFHYT